ncbi:MAG TPA: histidine kinase [Pseudonocardiaceae bacterium]|nr:histidine kinase [Pseudonocardiaceae bacterium]
MFGDSVVAVLLALLSLLEGFSSSGDPLFYWPVAVLMVVPLVFRRRRPLLTAYLIAAGGLLQLLTNGVAEPIQISDISLAVALYTLVVYAERRQAVVYAGVLLVGSAIDLVWRFDRLVSAVAVGIGALLIYGFSWVLGEFIGARRAYHSEVETRLRLLETERDQQATIAVAAERTRIARELHDVVAHAVSVIVVQADGAGYAIRSDPDLAETAVSTISATGREALIELRRLLDVLRSDTDDRATRAPQPDVTALPDLVEKVTAVGLPVRLNLLGELTSLPAAIGLGIYRIVQESLTNTLKHAGTGANAFVRVERVGGLVEVEVDDDGTGTGGSGDLAEVSGGNGLIGMRERATVLGGSLTAGQVPGGGWQVRAIFPVRASEGDGAV